MLGVIVVVSIAMFMRMILISWWNMSRKPITNRLFRACFTYWKIFVNLSRTLFWWILSFENMTTFNEISNLILSWINTPPNPGDLFRWDATFSRTPNPMVLMQFHGSVMVVVRRNPTNFDNWINVTPTTFNHHNFLNYPISNFYGSKCTITIFIDFFLCTISIPYFYPRV